MYIYIYISTLHALTSKCQITIYSKRHFFKNKTVILWFVQKPS